MELEALTEAIIGCAFRVHNGLGGGFLESVYEKSLVIELGTAGLAVRSQVPIPVWYRGQVVGDFVADLLVEESVVVELKAVETLAKAHEVQLVNYLAATGNDVGLLINFGTQRVVVKRKYRSLPSRPSC